MKIAIVDHGSGNLRSAAKAFERAAREADIVATVDVTNEASAIDAADRVVLPGVGAFRDCVDGLNAFPEAAVAVEASALRRAAPFFGICVGMQMLATVGREHGDTPGFGWVPGEVAAIRPADPALKIPHMGWNSLAAPGGGEAEGGRLGDHPVLAGVAPGAHVYFVHSYALKAEEPSHVLAETDYGGRLTAIVGRDNIVGTQFHPEKSQATGLRLIANFLKWEP